MLKTSLKIQMRKSEAINIRKTENTMANRKRTKRQTIFYEVLHRKLKIAQNEPYLKRGANAGDSEGFTVPAPHRTPVVLLLNATNVIWYGNRNGHQNVFCLLNIITILL